ncbi:MAG: TMEM198/TM7SF3 family protein [Lachnospiraceae bacterium]|nr:TMEM198/TM7SF3 family protein [Lachnospiraceae bacterium]
MDKFVLQLPKWQGELLFSKGTLMFVGVILLLIVGTLFCFWGYKYFRTVLFLGIGVVVCYGSYLLVEPMTANLVIRMFVTVSLTFLGMCFVYFLDIVFGYLLDRLRIRSALGKRTYLFAAPLGAAVLGLTIYGCIWRDAVVAAGISLACLVLGLVFQHHRRKGMVRFRCYNDLLRLRRPKIDEDGLEILSAGTTAAALASVSSALATSVPEAAPEAEPVAAAEPAPSAEPVAAAEPAPSFEPEPVFAMNAQGQALSEIESEFAAGFEYGQGARPVPEPMREEAEKSVTELEPLPAMSSAEEEEITPVPYEISESVKNLILRKMETDEELLEEAFFVKRISKRMSDKPDGAAAKKRESRSIRTERAGRVQTGRPSPSVRNRKSRRKREEGMVKAAVIAAAGLGAFIVGRVTKGGD